MCLLFWLHGSQQQLTSFLRVRLEKKKKKKENNDVCLACWGRLIGWANRPQNNYQSPRMLSSVTQEGVVDELWYKLCEWGPEMFTGKTGIYCEIFFELCNDPKIKHLMVASYVGVCCVWRGMSNLMSSSAGLLALFLSPSDWLPGREGPSITARSK